MKDPATERLFNQLTVFLTPIAEAAKQPLRPFSIATLNAMQLAGLSIGSKAFGELSEDERARQLYALLIIQTADLTELAAAIRAARGDFEKFYWDFVFPKCAEIPISGLVDVQEQVETVMPQIDAAQVEVITPPSMKAGGGDKPPPN